MINKHFPRILILAITFLMLFSGIAMADKPAVTYETMKRSRMVEAVIWSTPFTATWYFREACFRDAKADYNDVLYFSRPMEPNVQWLTPNQQSLYTVGVMNLKKDGPVVMEVPAEGEILLFGSFFDAWQVPLEDVGPAGLDKGKGGKYLIVPESYPDPIPSGYFVVKSATHNVWYNLRVVPPDHKKESIVKAVQYLKQYKVYPLSKKDNPEPTRFVDIADVEFDTLPKWDRSYFKVLNEFLSEETVQDKDKQMMEFLASVGLERGAPFDPSEEEAAVFDAAGKDGFEVLKKWLIESFGTPAYEGSRWLWPAVVDAANNSTYDDGVRYMTDRRSVVYFMANHLPKHLGGGTAYIVTFHDDAGELFSGEGNYQLHVPANAPVDQFWSLNLYDLNTSGFIPNPLKKVGASSLDTELQINEDGSVDLYFGKDAPEGKESNWIPTNGKDFYPIFRFYGPQEGVYDGSYLLPDIKRIQ